jgi:hypothetical protein
MEMAFFMPVVLIPGIMTEIVYILTRISYLYVCRIQEIAKELDVNDCFWATCNVHNILSPKESGIMPIKILIYFTTGVNGILIPIYFLIPRSDDLLDSRILLSLSAFLLSSLTVIYIHQRLSQDSLKQVGNTWQISKDLKRFNLLNAKAQTCSIDKLRGTHELRKQPRINLKHSVLCNSNGHRYYARTQNISSGGMLIKTDSVLHKNNTINLSFPDCYDSENNATELTGDIIRFGNNYCAVQFSRN